MKAIDIAGERFGRWTVVSRDERPKATNAWWLCQCDCGNRAVVRAAELRNGHSRSCGCLMREATAARNFRHGKAGTKEFAVWCAAKSRCHNENDKGYKYYGARGIAMCQEWRDSFVVFLRDMGPCPPGLSIDRIDNDGNYESSNCRWATREEQAKNRRKYHGHASVNGHGRNSPEYEAWSHAKRRCHNTDDRQYPAYGGRGITMCDEWRTDFTAFLRDVGPRPHGHTLDRINNDGNYEPGNCRWATRTQQANNTRRNRPVVLEGRLRSTAEAAVELGLTHKVLLGRLWRNGWDIEAARHSRRPDLIR